MNKEEALKRVKDHLPRRRFEHTLGVAKTAVTLANRFGADPEKAELAAIFHDIAKYFSNDELKQTITAHPELPGHLLNYHPSLWHAPVGAVYVMEQYDIFDQDILNAITYHTTGRSGMSVLEKVVFLADYIEPGRDFPGVNEVRALAEEDLDTAVAKALANTMQFLIGKYQMIYPYTVDAYNDLIKNTGDRLK
ncbi:bis(5'-nucleosyl)-tetraphosphatase (symmetrical) YqeK [Camelliibacillus cellulosilyticus]|uniref:bis(5'-nucleosyl)-tetraphosphatase (symmetrical) n=1 Tax=Camelliibacillus cellulosilyticus TaxID=2174486 RepID=A0ABV9GLF3_9BACL